MWWNISRIQRHRKVHTFEEMFNRNLGYSDERGGVRHSGGILGWAEDGNAIIGGSESFDAFVGLLAVVKGRSHAMEAEVGVCDEFWRGPLACVDGVVGFYVAIYFADSEADVVPVCIALLANILKSHRGQWAMADALRIRTYRVYGGRRERHVDRVTEDSDKDTGRQLEVRRKETQPEDEKRNYLEADHSMTPPDGHHRKHLCGEIGGANADLLQAQPQGYLA